MASADSPAAIGAPRSRRNPSANAGMSTARSRSGGSEITTAESAAESSGRTRPARASRTMSVDVAATSRASNSSLPAAPTRLNRLLFSASPRLSCTAASNWDTSEMNSVPPAACSTSPALA